MDVIIEMLRPYSFDLIFPASWAGTSLSRQFVEMIIFLALGGEFIYFFSAGLDYLLFFDKTWLTHKKILPNQIRREIWSATTSAPFMAFLTAPFNVAEWR